MFVFVMLSSEPIYHPRTKILTDFSDTVATLMKFSLVYALLKKRQSI